MSEYVPPDPAALDLPFVENPFLDQLLIDREWSAEDAALAREFSNHGYLVIDLEIDGFDAILAPHYGDETRLDEAWYFNQAVRDLASAPRVMEVLRLLYQREPIPFQTLNFRRGTEQAIHSDTIHFHSMPSHFMTGVWIALEDMDDQRGTLNVIPGSHRLPTFAMEDLGLTAGPESYQKYEDLIARMLEMHGFRPQELQLKRGQAVIWAANLHHGGSPIRNPEATRHSQANHYYFEDCAYTIPMSSNAYVSMPRLREVIDIGKGAYVHHRAGDMVLDPDKYSFGWRYPRPLPDWVDRSAAGSSVSDGGGAVSLTDRQRLVTAEAELSRMREELTEKDEFIELLRGKLERIWSSTPHRVGKAIRDKLRDTFGGGKASKD
jgi:hypothetical protein